MLLLSLSRRPLGGRLKYTYAVSPLIGLVPLYVSSMVKLYGNDYGVAAQGYFVALIMRHFVFDVNISAYAKYVILRHDFLKYM